MGTGFSSQIADAGLQLVQLHCQVLQRYAGIPELLLFIISVTVLMACLGQLQEAMGMNRAAAANAADLAQEVSAYFCYLRLIKSRLLSLFLLITAKGWSQIKKG